MSEGMCFVALMIIPTLDTSANRQLPLSTRSSDWPRSLPLDTFPRVVLVLATCHLNTLIHDDIMAEAGRNMVNSFSNLDEDLVIRYRSREGSSSRTLRPNEGTKTPVSTSIISAHAWYLYRDSRFPSSGDVHGSHRLAWKIDVSSCSRGSTAALVAFTLAKVSNSSCSAPGLPSPESCTMVLSFRLRHKGEMGYDAALQAS